MSDSGSRLEEARVNNVMGKAKVEANAQADYYTLMTRNAKLLAARTAGVISAAEETAINSLGDLEKWELKALARLYKLGDNSPELLQYLHSVLLEISAVAAVNIQKLWNKAVEHLAE